MEKDKATQEQINYLLNMGRTARGQMGVLNDEQSSALSIYITCHIILARQCETVEDYLKLVDEMVDGMALSAWHMFSPRSAGDAGCGQRRARRRGRWPGRR